MHNIPFNKPPLTGLEKNFILEALQSDKISGDSYFAKKCESWFEQKFSIEKALLMPNCTQALEVAAILADIQAGDEVIVPSYTFVSTANAFVLRGAKIVFVDIRPDTMNIDETKIEAAITNKTKAIVPVHYAGVACEMDTIMEIAGKYDLLVIEDAAQGMMASYNGKALGTIGHIGAFSFHETKNYTSGGEGGLLLINDSKYTKRAEIVREKGTNRSQFFRGMVDKYTWVDIGSSYLPSEVQAAYLWGQLQAAETINEHRLNIWDIYYKAFQSFTITQQFEIPTIPNNCEHNAHMFYLKLSGINERTKFIDHMKSKLIGCVFHYVPLHTSPAGIKHGRFFGDDVFTSSESERLVRLPIWFGMTEQDANIVINSVKEFFNNSDIKN